MPGSQINQSFHVWTYGMPCRGRGDTSRAALAKKPDSTSCRTGSSAKSVYGRALPIRLSVEESTRESLGRGYITLTSWACQRLRAQIGDVVELSGKKRTAAVVVRSAPADIGKEITRMDWSTRQNAGVKVGDPIQVRRVIDEAARSVLVAPLNNAWDCSEGRSWLVDLLSARLMGRAVHRWATPLMFRNGDLESGLFRPEARLMILSTEPPGIVRVGSSTKIRLASQPVSEQWVEQNRAIQKVLDDFDEMNKATLPSR